jgi:lipid II:glycine glycyltransferase (peptidoglycan interpeptide bridge formation enzyme)
VSDAYTSNWSRNLRRGLQRDVTADQWLKPDAHVIATLHQDVEDLKQPFHAQWRGDDAAIKRLLNCFGERLVLVRAHDANGVVLAMRAAVVVGLHAYDFLAATSKDGRKTYASNVALDALLGLLAARGVTSYDFGGVDRVNNKGVFDFKHGAGGTEQAYGGEFETVVPRVAKSVVSKLVSLRLSA